MENHQWRLKNLGKSSMNKHQNEQLDPGKYQVLAESSLPTSSNPQVMPGSLIVGGKVYIAYGSST